MIEELETWGDAILKVITIIGEKMALPLTGDGQATCPNTGKRYYTVQVENRDETTTSTNELFLLGQNWRQISSVKG